MECVLGVSLTPSTSAPSMAVRMVLVEGAGADGLTVDHDVVDLSCADIAEQVVSAIIGTREVAIAGGHQLISTGVTWTDRGVAAQLRKALTGRGVTEVVLVSELHAAGALAQAVGRAVGYQRTALMFVERDNVTLSIVETVTGAIVKVQGRHLHGLDPVAELRDLAIGLESLDVRPQGVFIVGSGVDLGAVKSQISAVSTLPVHAPEEAELALARGAALAAAKAPRYEPTTIGFAYARDTEDAEDAAGAPTQMADADYMAPLGYSQVDEGLDEAFGEDSDPFGDDQDELLAESQQGRKPFLLVGSTLTSIFIIGVTALVVSLAVGIRPAADQQPARSGNVTPDSQPAALVTTPEPVPSKPADTIQEPLPVAQQAPRTVYVTPAQQAPAPVAAPAQAPAPAPAAPAPAPVASVPVPVAPVPAAPVIPVIPAPAYIPNPQITGPLPPVMLPPMPPVMLPQIWNPRARGPRQPYQVSPTPAEGSSPSYGQSPTSMPTPVPTPVPSQSSTSPTQVSTQAPVESAGGTPAQTSTQATVQAPAQSSSGSTGSPGSSSSSGPSQSSSGSSQTTLWPSLTGN